MNNELPTWFRYLLALILFAILIGHRFYGFRISPETSNPRGYTLPTRSEIQTLRRKVEEERQREEQSEVEREIRARVFPPGHERQSQRPFWLQ